MNIKYYIKWLTVHWRPHTRYLAVLFSLTAISGAVALVYPLVIGDIVTRLQKAGEAISPASIDLTRTIGILALIALGRFFAGIFPAARAYMNMAMECDIREETFGKILEKDYTFLAKFRTGDLVTRVTDDVIDYPKVAWFLCSGIFRALESTTKLVLAIIAMVFINWKLAVMSLASIPPMFIVFFLVSNRLSKIYEKQQLAVSRTNDLLEAAFSGIRIVKSFNSEAGMLGRLSRLLNERIGVQLSLAKLHMLVHSIDRFAIRVGQVVVIGAGGYMVLKGDIALGTIYTFYVYLEMMNNVVIDLPMFFLGARESVVSIDRIDEVNEYPVIVDTRREGRAIERIDCVEFRDVTFVHDSGAGVRRMTFRIDRGSRVAMIGPVGYGKSIILKILAGLIVPQHGEVLINGVPVSEYSSESILGRIGYVPQESLLVSESIRDNVDFARGISDDAIMKSLRIAQMHDDLERMPSGAATMLGAKGSLVSGGQRQRIAIARALANDPDMILFDDATASLDAHKEESFWTSFNERFSDRITFIVSHRLKTILMADHVFTMKDGDMVDHGSHDELAGRCHIYRSFMDTLEHEAALRG